MKTTMTRQCPKHGEFTAKLRYAAQNFGNGFKTPDIYENCPSCRAEREAAELAEAQRNRSLARERARAAVEVPRRFSHAELGTTGLHKTLGEYADTLAAHVADGDGLALIGPPGTGKTYAIAAMLLYLADQHAEKVMARAANGDQGPSLDAQVKLASAAEHGFLYRNSEFVGMEIRDSFKGRDLSELDVLQPYIAARLLVLDELGTATDDHARKSLATILAKRYENAAPTILVGNLARTELEAYLGGRVADRLAQCCRFIACTGPSKRRSPVPSTGDCRRGAA